ncbi:unnamed protein product [Pseudo-nitzschia multistriata]|uniref:Glycosyltransferase n=1 Tax=Pseudo-nitzschia multistriata TaxID=183589 RepID=A0A448YZV0_9STRA|nr:unnamed protein product [Pseudo-nitzschia multistriata]
MNDSNESDDSNRGRGHGSVRGSIVVVAKCPIPGKSKTRLIPLMGEEGSVRMAKAMLSDVLKTIDGCAELDSVRKILLYAPGTDEGLKRMQTLVAELGLVTEAEPGCESTGGGKESWNLLAMASSPSDLKSHVLGTKLEDALVRVRALDRQLRPPNGVVFLGMDAPILPLNDIVEGLERAAGETAAATLCPALDGGYAMLCVPGSADPARTFSSVCWSHPMTGMSQIKALTDRGIPTVVGKAVRDIDEAGDVEELCRLLQKESRAPDSPPHGSDRRTKNLEEPGKWSSRCTAGDNGVSSSHPVCHYTRRALVEAGLVAEHETGGSLDE